MEEIVKMLISISGRYNYHTVFQDWVETMALAIQNSCYLQHNELWENREQTYKDIMGKYTLEERQKFTKMFGMLTDEFESGNITDILGNIYMSQNSGNSRLGQFFTPFHLSELCARAVVENNIQVFNEKHIVEVNEPSTGGGGMMIAVIKVLLEKGINYQRRVHIVAQDLDWNGVYMTYVQLSLFGANATVVQGDTLKQPYDPKVTPEEKVLFSPMRMGVLP